MLTGVFRASYAYVFEPQASKDGGEPKYQITMLIPKSDTATVQAIQAGIAQAQQDGLQRVFGGQMPARLETPLYDGDGVRRSGEPFGEECRGHWVVRASSKSRPSVVGLDVQPIIDPNAFYSGCYARATINFFAYNKNGNRGVACGLNNVQKIADGEPLSGRTTAEEDFGGRNAWKGAATQGAQPSGAPAQGMAAGPMAGAPAGYQPQAAHGYPAGAIPAYAPQGLGAPAGYGAQPGTGATGYSPQPGAGAPTGYAPQLGTGMVDPVTGRPLSGGVMGL